MNYCTQCGAELVVGRFCTSCGAPTSMSGTPGDTAERPALQSPPAAEREAERTTERPPVRVPAAAVEPPPAQTGRHGAGSRYPLFADEVDATLARPAVTDAPPSTHRDDRRRPLPLWLPAVAVALVLALVVGVWLIGGDDPADDEADTTSGDATSAPSTGGSDGSQQPSDGSTAPAPDGSPADLAAESTATGPAPLPPGSDLAGRPVAYPPANMLDDDLATAYRIRGDATGKTVTFLLPEEATISEVGLVNGYAKKDKKGSRTVDWYPLNRKILAVEWVFDDGTTVSQDLRAEPVLQTIVVDDVRTSTIQLRLVEVSAPGTGALRKNVTAISDVLLRGTP